VARRKLRALGKYLGELLGDAAKDDDSRDLVEQVRELLTAKLDSDVLGALVVAKALSHFSITCELLGCECSKSEQLPVELRLSVDGSGETSRFLREFVTMAVLMRAQNEDVRLDAKIRDHSHVLTVAGLGDWENTKVAIREWWTAGRSGHSPGGTSWKLAILFRGRRGGAGDEVALNAWRWDESKRTLSATVETIPLYKTK
ncbi:MAG: hypothetical protein ACREA0_15665, partial [bacterium]